MAIRTSVQVRAKIQRRLPGRVPSTDDEDGPAGARLRLHLGRGVVDADAFEIGEPIEGQTVVPRAGGNDHRLRRDDSRRRRIGPRATPPSEDSATALVPSFTRTPNFRACRTARAVELFTGKPGRKAEVVLDPSRGARLAAEGGVLGERRRHPLRSPVDRSREASRARHRRRGGRRPPIRPPSARQRGRARREGRGPSGFRRTTSPGAITIGSSATGTSNSRSSASVSGEPSSSNHAKGEAIAREDLEQPAGVGVEARSDEGRVPLPKW